MEINGQFHAPAAVYMRMGGPLNWFVCNGKEKKTLPYPCPESNPSRPAHSLVTMLSEVPPLKRK